MSTHRVGPGSLSPEVADNLAAEIDTAVTTVCQIVRALDLESVVPNAGALLTPR